MKRLIFILSLAVSLISSPALFAQLTPGVGEFGIDAGHFANFPATRDYLKNISSVLYIAPYIRTGKHEFFAGLAYPLSTTALYFSENNVYPKPGAVAGYKFYIFDVLGVENLFIHYTFQYLRYSGSHDQYYTGVTQPYNWKETDTYINNVIGLGYNVFLDKYERFGFFYTLDYVISQTSYKLAGQGYSDNSWSMNYVWHNLSTNLGFSFKLTPLKKVKR